MRINKRSITFKYLNAFILFIVIPIIIMSIVVNKIYINTLLMNSSESILQTMEQIALGVDNETKRISLLASTISNDDEIMELVTQWNHSSDPNLKFNTSRQIDMKLNSLFNYSNDVESVMFFFKGTTQYCYKSNATLSVNEIKAMPWYKASMEDKGKTHILGSLKSFTTNSRYEYVISVSISPEIPKYRNDIETIYLAFHSNILNSFYSGLKYNKAGELLLLDADNKILVSKNQKLLGRNVEALGLRKDLFLGNTNVDVGMIDGKKKFITVYTINKTRWHIVNLIDYKDLTKDIDRISRYLIIIFVLIIALFFIFSIQFFRNIIIPINNLIQKMKQVEKGDFNTHVDIKRDDEIFLLGKSFNRMVQEIKNLIKERDIIAREKSKAEIEVLQSQINPHFISNTLNSIRLMAMIAKVDSVKNMVEAFMKLLLASFSKTNKLIRIEE
ncbi:MAG: sensor histidine kinase, partial [Ruminiclostridium sp.]